MEFICCIAFHLVMCHHRSASLNFPCDGNRESDEQLYGPTWGMGRHIRLLFHKTIIFPKKRRRWLRWLKSVNAPIERSPRPWSQINGQWDIISLCSALRTKCRSNSKIYDTLRGGEVNMKTAAEANSRHVVTGIGEHTIIRRIHSMLFNAERRNGDANRKCGGPRFNLERHKVS